MATITFYVWDMMKNGYESHGHLLKMQGCFYWRLFYLYVSNEHQSAPNLINTAL